MKKEDFQDYLCRPFCLFYREGGKEDLACRGAQVVGQLLKQGVLNAAQLQEVKKNPGRQWNHDTGLDARVCRLCLFREEDCDFHAENPPSSAEPCGGYILLTFLKERGILSDHDFGKIDSSDS